MTDDQKWQEFIDYLAGAIERVNAIRDELREQHQTEDGVPFTIGDNLWCNVPGRIKPTTVQVGYFLEHVELGVLPVEVTAKLYSTHEAAQAAKDATPTPAPA